MQAAEFVFAEKGVDKATLREITGRANVNLAAVSYYFGSKSDLTLAVFSQLSTRLNKQRLVDLEDCLARAKAAKCPPELKAILEIFIRPYVDTGESGRLFARLVMQHRIAPTDLTRAIIKRHFDPMAKRFIEAISLACPHLEPNDFFWRYAFMIGTVVYSVADLSIRDRTAQLSEGKIDAGNARDFRDAMVNFLIGGMMGAREVQAPVSKARSRRLAATS
ncbi:TetR family transcriptional regulator [Chelatococcus reniformis]|nr:TetR family transcriptional regulator [Chelatococcus reniformis]